MSAVRRRRHRPLVGALCLAVLLLVGGLGLAPAVADGTAAYHHSHAAVAQLDHQHADHGPATDGHPARSHLVTLRGSVHLPLHEHLLRGHGSQPSAFRELALDGTWFGIRGPTGALGLRKRSTTLSSRLDAPLTRIRGPDAAPASAPDVGPAA